MIEKLKNIAWLIMVVFTLCAFLQSLVTMQPRVTKLEERANNCETRVSGIEIKLDALLHQTEETGKDIKDIYHLILDRHK